MKTIIAVDIGGTQLRVAVYPETGIQPINEKRIPTRGKGTAVERLMDLIQELWPPNDLVQAISAGAPGQVDPAAGLVVNAPNIRGWENLPLASLFETRFQVPAFINNDANLAAIGEWKFGAAQGYHDVLYITISTGIGGGVILNDELIVGAHGLATEIGHVVILPGGPVCGCGKQGHLEALASGTGIAAYFRKQLALGRPSTVPSDPPPTAKDISRACAAGDPLAREAFQQAAYYMGIGLANYLHLFNPSIVVIGGGVSTSGQFFWDAMRASMKEHALIPEYYENLSLVPAALKDECGLLGALALARSKI